MRKSLPVCCIGSILLAGTAAAEEGVELHAITVESTPLSSPVWSTGSIDDTAQGVPADAGDLLRAIPGVSGTRMGGHAIDPIIRGQSQTQLNILLDGAYIHGGCPNRMDPPSSYAALQTYDRLTVIKGSQTVIYGGGGSGGTVLFERVTPRFAADENLRGRVGAAYRGNSNTREGFADVAVGNPQGYARVVGEAQTADNYEDGDGREVRSAYKQKSASAMFGWTPDDDTVVELGLEAVRGEDFLFAGAGMDAPLSDTDTARLKFERGNLDGVLRGISGEIYRSDVEHLMDNYSLRPAGMMKMKTPSDSLTTGGRLSGELARSEDTVWTVGVDHQGNDRDATAFMVSPTGDMARFFLWPDVRIAQTGLFGEVDHRLSARDQLTAGLRYDRVGASADKAASRPGMNPSPNDLYFAQYGVIADDRTEHNAGGFVRLTREFGAATSAYVNLSRSVRTADATERFMAKSDWIGNPALDPERHHQLDVGLTHGGQAWSFSGSVYVDRVNDYILRDRDGAVSIYRNVNATLYGTDMELNRAWARHWSAKLTLAYVHATNTADDRSIAQIPPLELGLALEHARETWTAGARVRVAARQDRADLASGLDARETPGFAVLDVYGDVKPARNTSIAFGIDNLLDRTYAEHVNRANVDPFNPEPVQVNEPGRAVWVKGNVRF